MNQIKLGIIGLGKWVREAYLPILHQMPEVRVVAVSARTQTSRDLARAEFGPNVALFSDYHDLLKDPCVQAVAIALPNHLHADAIQAAASAGKHIFFEPPLGLSVGELEQTFRALSSADGVAQVDLELRCLPVLALVREHLQNGTIGRPLMTKVRLWCDWGLGGGEWVEEVESQGFFLWLGCWYLDLLDWVYQVSPVSASVVGGYAMNGKVMDHGWATLDFADQQVGAFEFNLVGTEGTQISLCVAGTEGELEADLLTGTCRARHGKNQWRDAGRPCSTPVHGFAGMRESIADFLAAVTEGTRPRADLEACRRVHEAALACTQAEREKRIVAVQKLTTS